MNEKHALEVIDVRGGNSYATDLGAIGATAEETYKMFLEVKELESEKKYWEFMVDYYDQEGDLIDSVGVLETTIEHLTSEKVRSNEYYKNYDQENRDLIEYSYNK